MNKYDMKALATGRKGQVVLPAIEGRLGSEVAFRTALRKMLKGYSKEVRDSVLPAFQSERSLVQDGPREWFMFLRRSQLRLEAVANQTVERVLRLEADRHTDTWRAAVERTLGIDLAAVVRREDLTNALEAAVARNTGLIKSLSDDTVKRVEQTVLQTATTGTSVSSLRKKLKSEFGVMDRRAQLIARDQVAKINSDLNQLRQTQAGVTKYIWRTAQDERVRSRHRQLDGQKFTWGKPTGAEDGLPPGQPIRCRCVALGVVEF